EGKRVGRHHGLSFYTLGQRKGLGVGGVKGRQREDGTADAWYVARKDLARNVLHVVQGHDHPWLLSDHLQAQDASWVAGRPPEAAQYGAKTRYRQPDADSQLVSASLSVFELSFSQPQWAVTPGQSAVLY